MTADLHALSAEMELLSARLANARDQARLLRAEVTDIHTAITRVTLAIEALVDAALPPERT